MYYVYALESLKYGIIYVGMTADIDNRVREHNSGKSKFTKTYRPWVVFYHEEFNDRATARKREKQLKHGSGKEFLKRKLQEFKEINNSI